MNRRSTRLAARIPEVLVAALWVLVAITLAACAWGTPGAESDRGQVAELTELRHTIAAVNADWVVAMQAHDAHRATQAYADDAIFVTRDGAVLVGREAIERATVQRVSNGSALLDGKLEDDGVEFVSSDLVYEWGHSALRWRAADGAERVTSGRFLTVWRLADGRRLEIVRNLTL